MRHTGMRTVGFMAVLAAAVLSACGDDGGNEADPGGSTTSASTTAPATSLATTTTASPGPGAGGTTVVPTTPPGTDLGVPTLDDASSVSTTGLDTVTFGMSLAQAEKAAGTRLLVEPAAATTSECAVVVPEEGPAGVSFTVYKGTIERVDLGPASKIKTRSGAGVTTTVAQLQSLYGDRVAASGTAYVFTPVDAADAAFRVVFETDGSVVTSFRAGRTALVASAAPCT